MPVYRLNNELIFPPPESASPEGLVAIGGDASPERLILGYSQGIFPWPSDGQTPLLWFSPDPRFVLVPGRCHVGRSLRKRARHNAFTITMDTAFSDVIHQCARVPRSDQFGSWITDELIQGYCKLHRLGLAHSVEAWSENTLVGGLYGVSLGHVFFGESMFSHEADASKLAFITLVAHAITWDFNLIDCQVETGHLARFGARPWSRSRFLAALRKALIHPTRYGTWDAEISASRAVEVIDHAIAGQNKTR